MKLIKNLQINGETVHIVKDHVSLFHNAPGRATFTIESQIKPSGRILLSIGYAEQDNLTRFFNGFIETASPLTGGAWLINCQETCTLLNIPLPVSLQHPTLVDVTRQLSNGTGLKFNIPDKDYAKTKIPRFYTRASGIHSVTQLGDVFSIASYIWCQQGDNRIYVGSWKDSLWAKRIIELPDNIRQKVTTDQLKLPVIPNLRPHTVINNQRVASVELCNQHMTVTWIRS